MSENLHNDSHHGISTSEENEIKISIDPSTVLELQDTLRRNTASERNLQQVDTYYDFDDYFLTNLSRGLRIRTESGIPPVLEFKSLFHVPIMRPENPWLVEEIIFQVPMKNVGIASLSDIFMRLQKPFSCPVDLDTYDQETLDLLLKFNNLDARIVVKKDRVEYVGAGVVFSLDKIDDLGYFLELEMEDDLDPYRVLGTIIDGGELPIVREGYNDLIVHGNALITPVREKSRKFRRNYNWNVLPGEESVIRRLLTNE